MPTKRTGSATKKGRRYEEDPQQGNADVDVEYNATNGKEPTSDGEKGDEVEALPLTLTRLPGQKSVSN
jgi:hypothetical protein